MVDVRAVKNALQRHENVVQNYIAIGIYSSAATLNILIEGFDRHVTKSLINIINLN